MSVADAVLVKLRDAFGVAVSEVDLARRVGVYDIAVAPPVPARYVVLYAPQGLRSSDTVAPRFGTESFTFQVTSAASRPNSTGSSRPQCEWLATRARDALVGWVPEVPGLVCGPIEHILSNPPAVDEDVKDRSTVYATDQYRVLADRT